MTTSELRFLTVDGPREPDCPYCEQPGGSVPYAGHYLHQHCYESLGRELNEHQPLMEDLTVAKTLESVQVRTEPEILPSDPNQEAYAIEDRDGNVLGYTTVLNGPEQRAAIAKVMGVDESKVSYKGDDEDENGPVEVWGLVGVPVPVLS